jgi:ADP-ribose pyrophosphatase YjhB (NUDIX family)
MSLRTKRGGESVSVVLWDGERVLLVRRGGGGLFPRTWTLPGGPLQPPETPPVAARRIARDLLKVGAGDTRLLRRLPQPSPFRDERGPDTVVQLVSWEGEPSGRTASWDGCGWFSLDGLGELRMFREAREEIVELCEGISLPAPAGVRP